VNTPTDTNEEVSIGQTSGLTPYTTRSHGKFCQNYRMNPITHSANSKILKILIQTIKE